MVFTNTACACLHCNLSDETLLILLPEPLELRKQGAERNWEDLAEINTAQLHKDH